jgi:hypothetical protein
MAGDAYYPSLFKGWFYYFLSFLALGAPHGAKAGIQNEILNKEVIVA